MPDAPLFSDGLLLSRPRAAGPWGRRAAALLGAAVLHTLLLTGAVVAPFLWLEMVTPPRAQVLDRIRMWPPATSRRTAGDGLQAPLGSAGGGRRSAAPASLSTRPPRPAPSVPALAPPEDPARSAPMPASGVEAAGPDGSRGGGDDTNAGPPGSPAGCPGCIGTGPSTGEGPPDSGPVDESDPRIVLPVPIPGEHAPPGYPELARRARLEGSVILLITIGADGTVGEVEVLRSPDPRWGFDLAAIDAVRRWRYHPALLHGRPVAVRARILVEFALAR